MSTKEIQFAKTHLRNHLATLVLPHVTDGLWSIYENAYTLCQKNREVEQTLRTFQNLLTRVAVWTPDVLRQEVERIESASKCEYLEELLTGVFLAYMRAFAAMQYRSSADAIEIDFDKPSLDMFVHELYKQVARGAWTHAYLFKTYSIPSEQQARNRKEIQQLLEDSLDTVLDSFLPWKDIAKNYFKEVQLPATPVASIPLADEDDEDEDDAARPAARAVSFSAPEEDEEAPALEIGEDDAAVDLGIHTLDAPPPSPVEQQVDLTLSEDAGTLVLKQ